MNKIILLAMMLLPATLPAQTTVRIYGKVADKEHTRRLYISQIQGPVPVAVDSADVDASGYYSRRLNIHNPGTYFIGPVVGNENAFWADTAVVAIDFDAKGKARIHGGAENELMNKVNLASVQFHARMSVNPGNGVTVDRGRIIDDFNKQLVALAHENATIPSVVYVLSFFDFDRDVAFIKGICDTLQIKNPGNRAVLAYIAEITSLDKGAPAPDFEYLSQTGAASSFRAAMGHSKYLLVDFWGTYCGPCRQGLPGIKKLYAQYHSKGLDVLTISLDNKDDIWKKSLTEENMPWAQGRTTDLGRSAMQKYRFSGIPYLALFDQQGRIIALRLSHEMLETAFRELMGAPDPTDIIIDDPDRFEETAIEKAMIEKLLEADLVSKYDTVFARQTVGQFIRSVLKEAGATIRLKDYQIAKMNSMLPAVYEAGKKIYEGPGSRKERQRGYQEVEKKKIHTIRYWTSKSEYDGYLQSLSAGGPGALQSEKQSDPLHSEGKDADVPIPLDPAVRTGELPNGFTYFIRRNEEPRKRVQLYLVNKVGSILESEDQRGLAHFMEHMNFNGTTHYPKNKLVNYLQKNGVRFGADLNAHTGFDETVYELPLPTDDPAMAPEGLNILRDWAHEALLDSLEIEKERGVVLEEKRLGKGANDRMSRKYLPVMLNHSRYAERTPIGLDTVLNNFRPRDIRKFHEDWYRPDLQAIVVVGDVDVNEMEKMIREKFSDLKNPAAEKPREQYDVPLTDKPQFLLVTDRETASSNLEISMKHKAPGLTTERDYLALMKRSLLNELLSARYYAEVNQEKDPAYLSANAGIRSFIGGLDMFAFDVTSKAGKLQAGFEQAWRVLEKVRRYGFTQTELERVKKAYLRSMEQGLKESDKTASEVYVKEYQNLFLNKVAAPGIAWEAGFTRDHLGAITLADISKVMKEYLDTTNQDILISGPEDEARQLADSIVVASWMGRIRDEVIPPFRDEPVKRSLLDVHTRPGKVTEKNFISTLNITSLALSNGVRIILKPTDFKNDEILFAAFSPGGTSLYGDGEYDAASAAAGMIARFGLGDLNPVQLNKVLNDKQVNVRAAIGPRSEIIQGAASPADLETALQMTYLTFTQPRRDTVLFHTMMNSFSESLANRYADPDKVFGDTINRVLGGYNYRSAPPDTARLNSITLQKIYRIYKERFADASGFTFVFVGNFTPESIIPMLEQYLGALPSTYSHEKARDLNIHPPAGRMTLKVLKGMENKATVRIVFADHYQYDPVNNLLLQSLGDILQIKLVEQLREDSSQVYSPHVQMSYVKNPENRYMLTVSFGCAPKNADQLTTLVEKEMAALRVNGPDTSDVQKVKASYAKIMELALKDNDFWLGYLSGQTENGENILQVLDAEKNLEKITAASLKKAADRYFRGNNRIVFQLLPEH